MSSIDLIEHNGRRLTAQQIKQLARCLAAATLLRENGFPAKVVEYFTGGNPKLNAAGIFLDFEPSAGAP